MLVPVLVDSELLSDEVPAVVQCAPAVRIESLDDHAARVHFLEPVTAAARGQAVVVYDDDKVVAGGWIQEVAA